MTKRTIPIFLSAILVIGGMLWFNSRPVAAQNPQPTPSDNAVNRVAKQLYCPVCENIPLDVCPTQACHDWRELIRQKLALGWTDQQITAYFAQQYGDRVLAEPPASGLNWIVYILPWVAFAGGVVIVWRVLVTTRKKSLANAVSAVGTDEAHDAHDQKSSDDPYIRKLEEELRKKE
jgi:cytochrome c-type biogenesis protein CcmH